jgi:hypothetical protein
LEPEKSWIVRMMEKAKIWRKQGQDSLIIGGINREPHEL